MEDIKIKRRIINKHDTAENWAKATNFIPLNAELIIYDPDEEYSYPRFKIGDGQTKVNDLPFSNGIGKQDIDQIYSATSENAQSGKAVAEAITSTIGVAIKDDVFIIGNSVTSLVNSRIENNILIVE